MKVEIEFELLKDEPKIETLIAGRVYALDCVDKPKDVKARVVDETDPLETPLPCDVKIGGITHAKGTSLRSLVMRAKKLHEAAFGPELPDAMKREYLTALQAVCRHGEPALIWPTLPDLITLPVRHMPEEVKQ